MIILSILVPTIPERHKMFNEIFNELYNQITYMKTFHPSLGEIEVVYDNSKRFLDGGPSIGAKLNNLVHRSVGKYVCVLHDDDWIAPNYLETLVRLCQHNADVITFRNITMLDTFWITVDMSIHYPNDQASPMVEVRRMPWNICPVRSELAKKIMYPESNYGEDASWMNDVLAMCTTESHTNAVLHQYRHGKHSEADKIMNS